MTPSSYTVLLDPSHTDVAREVNRNWRRKVIALIFQGTVKYGGRAKSRLKKGRYLFVSKPDGTLLIHGPTKRKPINWQPPGSHLSAEVEDERLKIVSTRSTPREKVTVSAPRIYVLLLTELEKGRFDLWESEKEMVDSVFSNPDLLEEGFKPIKRETKTQYGKIDLVGKDTEGRRVLCEFKRRRAEVSSVSQLKRYLQYSREIRGKKGEARVRGIIVAPEISSSAMRLLRKYDLEFKSLPTQSEKIEKPLEDYISDEEGN